MSNTTHPPPLFSSGTNICQCMPLSVTIIIAAHFGCAFIFCLFLFIWLLLLFSTLKLKYRPVMLKVMEHLRPENYTPANLCHLVVYFLISPLLLIRHLFFHYSEQFFCTTGKRDDFHWIANQKCVTIKLYFRTFILRAALDDFRANWTHVTVAVAAASPRTCKRPQNTPWSGVEWSVEW